MTKYFIFKEKPNKRNSRYIKRYGFIEINSDRNFIKLNLQVKREESKDMLWIIIKTLIKQGYYLLKMKSIHRAGNRTRSYLHENQHNKVISLINS